MPSAEFTRPGKWRRWLTALGPGAIIASLTIGTGELIFSTRAGALFGFQVLGFFTLVLLLKWALVFASARHWVFSDVHPLRRWAELPGPRGWLPLVLLVLGVPAFPVWVSFHSGTIGTLIAAMTDTREGFAGNASLVWGIAVLVAVLGLAATGGYARQERIQAVIVAAMVLAVLMSVALLKPDWRQVWQGFWHPFPLHYPAWASGLPEFASRPVWVEVATYAGVIGGSGYDYMAYVTWLRDKHGARAERQVESNQLIRWIAADATVSFLTVLLFSGAFVACGALVLGPARQVPGGSDLLTLQAQFVSVAGAWLKPLYFVGALLALGGTLYGTIEVAPAVLGEIVTKSTLDSVIRPERLRRWAVGWCGGGALAILLASLGWRMIEGTTEPFRLVALVTPANLFTGVLACGWISLLNLWSDRRFLPRGQRMNWALAILNGVGGTTFCVIGAKAAWDHGRWVGPLILVVAVITGFALAAFLNARRNRT